MNISLRNLRTDDVAWLDEWLPQIATAIGFHDADAARLLRRRQDNLTHASVIQRDGVAIGVTVHRTTSPAAIIELVAISPEHTRKGAGMAAAALLERHIASAGINAIDVPASAANGISMYFWIRLGYAPLRRSAWPCDRAGIAWLRRTIDG